MIKEFLYNVFIENNGAWEDITSEVDMPIANKDTLDETLDIASISLSYVERSQEIEPLTKMKIVAKLVEGENVLSTKTIYRYLNLDECDQVTFEEETPLYKHNLYLIEPTKELERTLCDVLTLTNEKGKLFSDFNTQSVERIYSGYGVYGVDNYGGSNTKDIITTPISTPGIVGFEYQIPTMKNLIGIQRITLGFGDQFLAQNYWCELYFSNDNKATWTKLAEYTKEQLANNRKVLFENVGFYRISYKVSVKKTNFIFFISSGQETSNCIWNYDIEAKNIQGFMDSGAFSLYNHIDRLLKVYQTRREGIQPQKYFIDEDIAETLQSNTSPEFYTPKSTLFEALLAPFSRLHAIPRLIPNRDNDLVWDTISMDELGGTATFDDAILYNENQKSQDIENYATCLDSDVDNILNATNNNQGRIIEPYNNGLKTVRCEDLEIIISNDTAEIKTEFPIYKILKVECGFRDGTWVGDITPYIYEETEYNLLTGFSDYIGNPIYPYSKAYALRYKMGGKVIDQLMNKITGAVDVPAFAHPAISNIIKQKTSGSDLLDNEFKSLAFRVTYIPIINARVKQYKVNLLDYKHQSSLSYSQTANIIDSEAYGENLKGTIAKLGNSDWVITAYYDVDSFTSFDNMPKIGMKYQNYYIYALATEFYQEHIKITMFLSKNFNKLSEYISIISEQRFYEVSEKQSLDRYLNYGECVIIGDFAPIDNIDNVSITSQGIRQFASLLTNTQQSNAISFVISKTLNEAKQTLCETLHSVISLSFGNSILFIYKYNDNYSAGFKSDYHNSVKNLLEYTPYGDQYGRVEYICMKLASTFTDPEDATQQIQIGNALPTITSDTSVALFNIDATHPLLVKKDGRECLIPEFQLHAITNRNNIIIGKAFMSKNKLIDVITNTHCQVWFLSNKINQFAEVINADIVYIADNIDLSQIIIFNDQTKSFNLASFTCPSSTIPNQPNKSWALVDSVSGQLILGVNTDVAEGEQTEAISFCFRNLPD